jgi:RHS repeat-associated protein
MYHAEGRAYKNGTSWQYEYTLKDHLGNSRVTFRDNNGSAEMLQENHYYPFGMNQEGKWTSTPNKYQYNGKELNEDLGLNWNDYGARWYDAAIGRWNSVDAMAAITASWTTYNYVENNPVKSIDPDGNVCVGCNSDDFSGKNAKLDDGSTRNEFENGKNQLPQVIGNSVNSSGTSAPDDHWKRQKDGSAKWVSNNGGDAFDTVEELDGTISISGVQESTCASCETSSKSVGSRVKAGAGTIRPSRSTLISLRVVQVHIGHVFQQNFLTGNNKNFLAETILSI